MRPDHPALLFPHAAPQPPRSPDRTAVRGTRATPNPGLAVHGVSGTGPGVHTSTLIPSITRSYSNRLKEAPDAK